MPRSRRCTLDEDPVRRYHPSHHHRDLDIKKYAFEVAKDANKIEIKKAIEEIFGVKVIKVTTINVMGKAKRTGAYPMGKTASWKKAVVKLSADSKNIELFEGMA